MDLDTARKLARNTPVTHKTLGSATWQTYSRIDGPHRAWILRVGQTKPTLVDFRDVEPAPVASADAPDKLQAARFAAALTGRDYHTAALVIAECVNAGDADLAALLLEGTLSAAMEAIQAAASAQPVTISQNVGEVPPETTVIGFRHGSIG